MKEFAGKKILLIVENLSVPFDKRPWREALSLREAGADVCIISPMSGPDNKKIEVKNEIKIFRYKPSFSVGSAFGYLKEYFWAFFKTLFLVHKTFLSQGKMNVIHVANPPDIFWPLALYGKINGIKFIFDEHDSAPEVYLSRFGKKSDFSGLFLTISKIFQKLSYKYSDVIISTNESYREKAIKISSHYARKTFIVRNGPDTKYFKPKNPNNSLKKGFPYMGAYIGIMARQDGVDYLIRAMNILVNEKKFNKLIVYLIGSGDDVPYLKQLVDQYKLRKYIIFTGRIPDEHALEILSTADIGLSPDPYNPLNDISTMNKVMEFMCLGKPIVSFDLKEARYSAQDAALYVENNDIEAFANGMLTLLYDKDLSKKMGKFGKSRVEKELSWQIQSENLLNSYRYIFSNSTQ